MAFMIIYYHKRAIRIPFVHLYECFKQSDCFILFIFSLFTNYMKENLMSFLTYDVTIQ